VMPRQTQSGDSGGARESCDALGPREDEARDSAVSDSKETGGEVPVGDDPAASAETPGALPTLDDLFAGAQGASCSIDGVCD
jgi:hypothetical protein